MLIEGISTIEDIHTTVNISKRLPGIVSLVVDKTDFHNERFIKKISEEVALSTGSACSAGEPSYVIQALGLADKVYEFSNKGIKEYLGGVAHFLEAKKLECFREYEQMHPRKLQQEDVVEEEIVSENKIAFEERKQWNKEIKKSEVKIEKLEVEIADLEQKIGDAEGVCLSDLV